MVERLTVTCADVGAQVEFLDFYQVFKTQTVYQMVDWESTFLWILSCYHSADLQLMLEIMGKIPTYHEGGVGTNASRKAIYNAAYIQYYRETGNDMETKRAPKGQNLTWVVDEVAKADAKAARN